MTGGHFRPAKAHVLIAPGREPVTRSSIAMSHVCSISLVFLFAIGLGIRPGLADTQPAPVLGYTVVARYPHSTASYTEGFFYLDGLFYEGTGREGHSAVLAIQPETGRVIRKVALPPQY